MNCKPTLSAHVPRTVRLGLILCLFGFIPRAGAVVIYNDGVTPAQNLQSSTPAPNNLGSYVGYFGGEVGTPIAPNYFVTANHIGRPGTLFYADGGATVNPYTATIAGLLDDLAIYKVTSPIAFTHYAPIYTNPNTDHSNSPLVVLGNGVPPANKVYSPNDATKVVGWEWGTSSNGISWGIGNVTSIVSSGTPSGFGGDFIRWSFDTSSPNDSIIAQFDSGGPVFVQDPSDGIYKLDGINSLVEDVSKTSKGPSYNAALFDSRGFYDGSTLVTGTDPVPLGSLATRLSSRTDFIDSVTGLPEPGIAGLLFVAWPLLLRHRAKREGASVRLRDLSV